ncbi:uncharacterized protein MONOS_17208 [Monocercomonoides exilis]|uniref:uncharacterized protein n=1 Tax=Monocercomonoides exilis TaxID=2049356 RepID=UPI003559C7D4|nr:hypothetical protein MONOS_17204 [Monocercomonoides exilis]KAH7828711.1 hypothetical protein MONOS_17208 [Monocercomonoides exilis]
MHLCLPSEDASLNLILLPLPSSKNTLQPSPSSPPPSPSYSMISSPPAHAPHPSQSSTSSFSEPMMSLSAFQSILAPSAQFELRRATVFRLLDCFGCTSAFASVTLPGEADVHATLQLSHQHSKFYHHVQSFGRIPHKSLHTQWRGTSSSGTGGRANTTTSLPLPLVLLLVLLLIVA